LISVKSSVDGFIALILSFATNLDHLDYNLYTESGTPIALKVMARSLQTPSASTTSASSTTTHAFSKLRHLSIVSTNETTIPIAPTLETLKICESDCVTLTGPSGYHGALKLHTLDVKNSSLMWDKLLEVVREGHLAEVAEIWLAGVSYKSALGLVIDQNPLVEALAAHMPKLEHLEWDCLDDDRQLTLTDLSGLTGVTILRIELRLVSTKLHFLDPERSTALLPPNLHALNVSSMSLTDLDRALRKLSEGERASFVRSVVDLTARFPLRSLSMNIGPSSFSAEMSRGTLSLLQDVADSLHTMGTHFALYKIHWEEDGPSMLVGRRAEFVSETVELYDHNVNESWGYVVST
jgi:hypothetical protein